MLQAFQSADSSPWMIYRIKLDSSTNRITAAVTPPPSLTLPLSNSSPSQPQLIPPKIPTAVAPQTLFSPPKHYRSSPPRSSSKGFLSNFTTHGSRKGFLFPTYRSSSVPSRTDSVVEPPSKPTPRSLPEERTFSAISPKTAFCRIGSLQPRQKNLKIAVLGQSGVGKTALVVRFITKRYIGEYDPNLERIYNFQAIVDNETVNFEILDTAGQPYECEHQSLEANIRWAEAYILMYSVTDKCSFDECSRLRFLINYNRKRRKLGSKEQSHADIPVLLLGNKTDQGGDRMVSLEEGRQRSQEIGCVCFHEISVRESVEQVAEVFQDACRFWRVHRKFSKLKRSSSDCRSSSILSPESCSSSPSPWPDTSPLTSASSWSQSSDQCLLKEEDEDTYIDELPIGPFRDRAQTDGLLSRPRWKFPPPTASSTNRGPLLRKSDRRMSISMRGNNSSC